MLLSEALPPTELSNYDKLSTGESSNNQRVALYTMIIIGIAIRLFHFFHNRSLFIDELYLDINLISMSFWELATLPFQYEQKAPIGYLWSVKLFVVLFGKGEKALRLFSLLCGVSTLFLFIPVARFYLKSWGVLIAVGILSLGWPFVYHSVEAKQYSTELCATVLALLLYIKYHKATDWPSLLIWGFLGGILLWFSFSLIFILAGLAIATCLDTLIKKEWKRLFIYAIPFSLWVISFGLLYIAFLGKYHQSGWLIDFFEKEYNAFMPLQYTSFSDLHWLLRTPYSMLHHPMGMLLNLASDMSNASAKYIFKMGWLSLLFIVFGIIILFRKSRLYFSILFFPIIITYAASAFKFYPIYARFVLFLAPLLILYLAFGVEKVQSYFTSLKARIALVILLLTPVFINSIQQLIQPGLLSDAKERDIILLVNDRFKEGDAVYVFWNMRHAYGYYKEAYNLKYTATQGSYVKNNSISAYDYLTNLAPDFNNFTGKKRLWFVYDINNKDAIGDYLGKPAWYHEPGFSAPKLVERELSKLGRITAQYNKNGLYVSLYELN